MEYQPNEVGRHKISVRYADVDINGSPFFTEAYDTNQVRIGNIPDGIVNQPVHFDGRSSMCNFSPHYSNNSWGNSLSSKDANDLVNKSVKIYM